MRSAPLVRALEASAEALGLRGGRVLVACSGGVDSVSLAHGLAALRRTLGVEMCVGHVDHGLREGSADDAAFVVALAEKLGAPVRVARVDPRALRVGGSSRERPTLQEAARRLRYRALAAQARELGCGAIATAHTLDDQAETVLLRLLRGAGPDGLAGIPERSPGGGILRPLLGVSRREVLAFAAGEGFAWREDPSNQSPAYARNRLRHDWIPALGVAFNPQLLRAIGNLAEALRRDAEWIDEHVDAIAAQVLREEGAGLWLDPEPWRGLPEALARRLVRRALHRVGGSRDVSRLHLLRALAFLREGRLGRTLELPGGLVLRREPSGFLLLPAGARPRGPC